MGLTAHDDRLHAMSISCRSPHYKCALFSVSLSHPHDYIDEAYTHVMPLNRKPSWLGAQTACHEFLPKLVLGSWMTLWFERHKGGGTVAIPGFEQLAPTLQLLYFAEGQFCLERRVSLIQSETFLGAV